MSLNNDELCLLKCFLSSPDYDNLITPDSEADAGETKHSQKDEKKAALHGLYQHARDKVGHHKRKRERGQKLPLTALATKKEVGSAKRHTKQVDVAKSMCLHGLLQSEKEEWERAQQYAVQQRLLQIEREKKILQQQLQIEMKALYQRELEIEHGHNVSEEDMKLNQSHRRLVVKIHYQTKAEDKPVLYDRLTIKRIDN